MASTLQQIAAWKSTYNPLEHVHGGGDICPCIVARGQDDHAQMILYSPDIEHERNVRWMYEQGELQVRGDADR